MAHARVDAHMREPRLMRGEAIGADAKAVAGSARMRRWAPLTRRCMYARSRSSVRRA